MQKGIFLSGGSRMFRGMIRSVKGREILDSDGQRAAQAQVELADGSIGTAGASERNPAEAADEITAVWGPRLSGRAAGRQQELDRFLMKQKEEKRDRSGGAMLAVSLACAQAAARSLNLSLYRYLGGLYANRLPALLYTISVSKSRAFAWDGSIPNKTNVFEIMLTPLDAKGLCDGLWKAAEIHRSLERILESRGMIPEKEFCAENILHLMHQAIRQAGEDPDQFSLFLEMPENTMTIRPQKENSLTAILELARHAQQGGLGIVLDCSEDQTGETAYADLATAIGAGWIKEKAPGRQAHTARLNRLIQIEEELRDL